MKKKPTKLVKFISYDGIIEPIGQSQVLSYVKKLSKFYSIKLVSYEKNKDLKIKSNVEEIKKELLELNILWKPLKYHQYLPIIGTIHNIFEGLIDNIVDLIRKKIIFFHIRGPLPGLLIIPFINLFKIKFIFDMRGFWADEKHDRLGWGEKSYKYKFFKKVEKKLLKTSSYIICLTNDAKKIIVNDYNISVNKIFILPTCVDVEYFKVEKKIEKNYLNFCHLGSIESAYNIKKTVEIFSYFLRIEKNIKFIFFTNQKTHYLKKLIYKYKIPNYNYKILSLQKK